MINHHSSIQKTKSKCKLRAVSIQAFAGLFNVCLSVFLISPVPQPCKQIKVTARLFFFHKMLLTCRRCFTSTAAPRSYSRKSENMRDSVLGKNFPLLTTKRLQEELLPFKLLKFFCRRTSEKELCHPLVVHSRREAGFSISKVSRCPTADQEISCTRFTANNETSGRDLGREENVTWYRQNKTAVCMPESRGRKLRAKQVTSTTQTPKPTPLSDGMIKRQKDKLIDRQAKK